MKLSSFCCGIALLIGIDSPLLAIELDTLRVELDPAKVVKYEACLKCHGNEVEVWKKTPHFKTFRELHREDEAKQIASRMGIKSIKRGGICIECHYTPQATGSGAKPVSGISCESCHGAARDWLAIHNDYGGPDVTKEAETPEHRRQRLEESIRHGMRNPENLYLIAQSCFGCHTVPNEELVNVGGHQAGSEDFNMVQWSQGSIRHKFLESGGTVNTPNTRERLRVMYVIGLMADLEYSLRATAAATTRAKFGFTNAQRVFDVRKQLGRLQLQLNNPLIDEALQAAYDVKLKLGNQENLLAAAKTVGDAAFRFAARENGSNLSAVDALLPAESTYK